MSINVPRGFRFAGVHCGIKGDPEKRDLSLIVCDDDAVAAGVYTQNLVYAAPVALDRQRTPAERMRVVVVNSGNANACTGGQGMSDAREMTRLAAQACGAKEEQALVMSTGIIGEMLPMEKIAAGIGRAAEELGSDEAAFLSAADGILTTDNGRKLAAETVKTDAGEIRLAGMAKGAGMIGPNMATMLAVVATDAALTPSDAQAALSAAVDDSFNCICVEGHMSTNDTVLLLASGAAAPSPLAGDELGRFRTALGELCGELARQIPNDGEGATHLIHILVRGCATRGDAHQIAKTVAESALVRAGIAGADPNWGRIVSAAGYARVKFDPARVDLFINDILLYKQGAPVPFDNAAASASIRDQRDTFVVLQLGEGEASCRFWASDLTVDYVRFNSDYHT